MKREGNFLSTMLKTQRTPDNLMQLIDLTKKSDMSHKHAAIIYKSHQKILACGYNHSRGCILGKPINGLHAEVDALMQLLKNLGLYSYVSFVHGCYFTLESIPLKEKKRLKGLTMMVIRHNMGNSRPCKHCLEFIRSVGIKKLIYSDDGSYEEMKVEEPKFMDTEWISRGDIIRLRLQNIRTC